MNIQALPTLAQETGLRHDKTCGVLFGYHGGYNLCLVPDNRHNRFDIILSVTRGGSAPTQADFQPLVSGCKDIAACIVQGQRVILTTKANAWSQKKCLASAKTALEQAVSYLRYNSFENACQQCGSPEGIQSYFIGGSVNHLCPGCFGTMSIFAGQKQHEQAQKSENVVGGAVGALLGALIGALAIVILSQMGYIAALSGIIMAVCTLKGYEMLGGKLSGLGIAVSILIMIAMVYVGDRVSWAIDIAEAFGAGFFEAFQSVHMLISSIGGEVESSYTSNLVMQYLFVAIGAVPTIVSNRKNSRVRSMTYRLGSGS